MTKVWIIIAVVIIIAIAGYFIMRGNNSSSPVSPQTMTKASQMPSSSPISEMTQTIILAEQNDSSESGTAVLMEKDGKVVVTLNMTGAPNNTPQPAHIHTGSCPDVGAVVYPLTNLVNGKSETTLDVTFAGLKSQLPLGINVHKSVPEAKVYVSCGDIMLPGSSVTPSSSSTNKNNPNY